MSIGSQPTTVALSSKMSGLVAEHEILLMGLLGMELMEGS